MDFNIKLKSGLVLKGMIRSAGDKAKAVIIFVHGLGDHIQRYEYWAGSFTKAGISFTGVDLPGHGRSGGRKGYIRSYKVLDEMLGILLDSCHKTFPGIPVYIYGHSLGGGIVLNYILRVNPKIKGAIVTSPWLRLSFEPPRVKVILASLIKNIIPGLIQPSGLNVSHLSRDPSVVENYKNDPLVHGKISLSLFAFAVGAARYSIDHAGELRIPLLIMHGSADKITSPEGSREFAQKTGKAELKIWEGGYHELHNEPFKDEVFDYIINWIRKPK